MSRLSRMDVSAMEMRVSSLIEALRSSGGHVEIDLAGRLWRCQQQRHERRRGLRDRVDRPCRSVACEYCRRWRAREWRERAAEQMSSAENAHSSMVTIMLERAGELSAVRDIIRDFRVALRNLRDRRARADGRWRKFAAVGLAELDFLEPGDLPLLPSMRRAVISALPVRSHGDQGEVVVHVHLAVSHPMIPRHAVERAFMQQWDGAGRVDVGEFYADVDGPENAAGIIAYAAKHRMVTTFHAGVEMPVPMSWQARYWGWLHGLGCGLAPLRVRMTPMRDPVLRRFHAKESEPMPILLGVW